MPILREEIEERIILSVDAVFLKWRIQSFGRLAEENENSIHSNSFSCFDSTWNIIVYPKMSLENSRTDYIGIFISRTNYSNPYMKARLKAYLKDYKNQDHYLWDDVYEYCKEKDVTGTTEFAETLDVLDDEKREELCPNDVLTLCFEISAVGNAYFSIEPCSPAPVSTGETSFFCYDEISETFRDMLKARKYSDLTVVSCGQKFAAHKAVLSAYSPVIARKLQRTTRRKASNVVEIEDFNPSLVRDFIGFMYSGRVQEMTYEKAMNLLSLAEDFEVEDLMTSCIHYLSRIITLDNFSTLMYTADRLEDEHLLEALKKFFSSNYMKIILKSDWAFWITRYPKIIGELKKCLDLTVVESDTSLVYSPSNHSSS